MRGYSIMSDKERESIIKQHSQVYDGYSVGNVTSNMTPLTVYDAARDKGGITVTNTGNVKSYTNNKINETAAMNFHYDEIDEPYQFKSGGPMDSYREEYDEFNEVDEEDVDKWEDVKNPEVENITDVTEEINKSLDMFKRFKKYN
jgi:hypothetical protein